MDNVTQFYLRNLDQFGAWLAGKCPHNNGTYQVGFSEACNTCGAIITREELCLTYTADPKAFEGDILPLIHWWLATPLNCNRIGGVIQIEEYGVLYSATGGNIREFILMALWNSPKGEQFRQERGI